MRPWLGALFPALALLTAGLAGPAAADPACTRLEGEPSLVGSRWAGPATWSDGANYDWTLLLRADCVVVYSYGGETFSNGRWYQRGTLLVIDTNDSFAVYMGQALRGRASGTMYNQRGENGVWTFRRLD